MTASEADNTGITGDPGAVRPQSANTSADIARCVLPMVGHTVPVPAVCSGRVTADKISIPPSSSCVCSCTSPGDNMPRRAAAAIDNRPRSGSTGSPLTLRCRKAKSLPAGSRSATTTSLFQTPPMALTTVVTPGAPFADTNEISIPSVLVRRVRPVTVLIAVGSVAVIGIVAGARIVGARIVGALLLIRACDPGGRLHQRGGKLAARAGGGDV